MRSISETQSPTAPIVSLASDASEVAAEPLPRPPLLEDGLSALNRATAFAEPLLTGRVLDSGEDAFAHAQGVAAILASIGGGPSLQAASFLVYAADFLQRPEDIVEKAFGPSYASLVVLTRKLVQIQRAAREARLGDAQRAEQTERVRKMLLAFSKDLRVVLLRLASRLQTLRWFAASKRECPAALAEEARAVFAPLANRLGIWQIKWELEDLSFRFLQGDEYRRIAKLLAEKRVEREASVEAARLQMASDLQAHGIPAVVYGRPKHIYSIWKKMQGKHLPFEKVMDVRALRVVVADIPACYAALSRVHERYRAMAAEYDDYIAKPKPNGYRSLHTVVLDDEGRPLEVQIRTQAMHEHAEYGVAAHWAYKEAGTRGYGGVSAAGDFEQRVAEARKAVLRQLLAWERDFSGQGAGQVQGHFDDRIYVFTPQAALVELTAGATPVDFAYALHTDLGHRCRGAKVDGTMVPLTTPLANGQTVEITAVKEGGPSLDWLNPEAGFLKSPRARAKVRAWFNARAQADTIARGREAVEKLLQREGKTALKLSELASQLGFKEADSLFELVGKDEYSLRNIEQLLRPPPVPAEDDSPLLRRATGPAPTARGGVLVVGVDSLLTNLARCCRPAPPDAIGGFVTRGKGVAVHRLDCSNFRHMADRMPERVIAVTWGAAAKAGEAAYPVDVQIEAADRTALLRDISEVFAKERMQVVGVHSQTVNDMHGRTARMTFTIEVADASRLQQVLAQVGQVAGVRQVRRR
ncbi:bifunctional (p)ppGpp synthetase/guanosine-3',5'-bis(diphosphate) 3'-pyrophosphohydrolase [Ideonella sp. B7]|uniref:RelA/SpoT family protein n=1 Tax=Ideonella benzenivorans TaxID=2831643 RepID=UPI001CEC26C4|nr:bifunctional (p)ppGpp synthetase/guanosine-3',5'-bis(diphosphate) 3'-pyrophosphohydrolase [Ideonella benzenivorans]MCA6217507.1 bifunctional (p)ppGpp synthetase/guanosine-3',5'-bis(diphosphate) 3'-pyrophosphohydrolase [Ideonella benzenivorans]